MWRPYVVGADAQAFQLALDGEAVGVPSAALAEFAAGLAAACSPAESVPSERGRERLLAAVAARRAERRANSGAMGGIRGGALAAAAVAGGGLLIAGAASNSSTAAFVRQVVEELDVFHSDSGEPALSPVPATSVAAELTLEGTIVDVSVSGAAFTLETTRGRVVVEVSRDTVITSDSGAPATAADLVERASVRVRGTSVSRDRVRAGWIEVHRGPASATNRETPGRPLSTPIGASTPDQVQDSDGARPAGTVRAADTPSPAAARSPIATPTGVAAVPTAPPATSTPDTVTSTAVPTATFEPTRTPIPKPTATPTVRPTEPPRPKPTALPTATAVPVDPVPTAILDATSNRVVATKPATATTGSVDFTD